MSKRANEMENGGLDKKIKTDNIDSQLINQDKNDNAADVDDKSSLAASVARLEEENMNESMMGLQQSSKPVHGSEEWHKQRKENHKNVERRRRESINAGIKELASLIPTSDTNKSQILQRAVEYIKRLKENETNNIEKWTLEKLLTEQAVTELDNSNQKLKAELEKCYIEIENYKRLLEKK